MIGMPKKTQQQISREVDSMLGHAGHVTDAQIRALRRESAAAGDHAQALLCDLALGDVVLDENTSIDSLRIASFLSPREKRRISTMDPGDYREECERAIEAGRG